MIILQTVGLLERVISLSQGLYLNTGQHKHKINTYTYQTSMPCVGFEPTIPASERGKTVHASGRSVTVTGKYKICPSDIKYHLRETSFWKRYEKFELTNSKYYEYLTTGFHNAVRMMNIWTCETKREPARNKIKLHNEQLENVYFSLFFTRITLIK
jgi:hypothetical protein